MQESQLTEGKAIHRRTGRTFYYATRLLPKRIREQTYVLYGFFRIADEVVDGENDLTPAEQRDRLEAIRDAALGRAPAEEPVVDAFAELRERNDIPEREVNAFVDAMLTDIDTDRYETHEDLREYMRGSAAAVGHMMTAIMNPEDPDSAHPHAGALGEAFQLTNFVRDVREDIEELDRVYLPMETLENHGVTVDQLRRADPTPEFRQAIRAELQRTEDLYREGVAGIKYLPEDAQFAVLLAAVLYAEHHRLIRRQNFDVLTERPSLSSPRKLWTVARTWWCWRRLGDPVAVFRRVSAVPAADASAPGTDEGPAVPHPE
ncbi:MAG: phytoene/squalene synthase family protein [Salinirussus sp.]